MFAMERHQFLQDVATLPDAWMAEDLFPATIGYAIRPKRIATFTWVCFGSLLASLHQAARK